MPLRHWLEYSVIIFVFGTATTLAWACELPVIARGMGLITLGAVVMLVEDAGRQWE